ncbi:DNA-directed RNA polymerase III subunit Rpc31 domain containing protein [Elaphomyces granulatus]
MAVPSSYDTVNNHLDNVLNHLSVPLDIPALEKLALEITENTDHAVPATLITKISQVLPVLQEDPTPLTTLGIRATSFLTFSELRSIQPPLDFVAGLKAPSPPINLLALSLLRKAGKSSGDAAIVAGNSELVRSLIEVWLSTSATEVAKAALDVLWSLLEVDHVESKKDTQEDGSGGVVAGQGLMWRRVFTDKDVYGLLFSICSVVTAGKPDHLSKREKTVAQGRLVDFVVKAGSLRWDAIAASHLPEIEFTYRCSSLLHFAACQMIDTKDVLMHMTLLNFLRELLQIDAPGLKSGSHPGSSSPFSSPALDFLVSHDLHKRILGYYLDPSKLDSVDTRYLSSPIMAYVAQYAQLYPNHLLQCSPELLDSLLSLILRSLKISSAQWAHGPVPTGDLTILSCLPRVMLVEAGKHSLNPLQLLPTNPANKDVMDTLSRIFHGPESSQEPPSMDLKAANEALTDTYTEAAAARILYFTYLNEHEDFWHNIVTSADILAIQDVALSAIALARAVATANWQTLSSEGIGNGPNRSRFHLPSEDELGRLSPARQGVLPESGAWALLVPPALSTVLPYLFQPPKTFANFVGGGSGDTESAVWRIVTAKYDLLVALYDRLNETSVGKEGFAEGILRPLEQRVRNRNAGIVNVICWAELGAFGRKGKKFPGADLGYDHEPSGEGDNEPTPLFPEYSVPCVRPLSSREESEVDRYRQLRENFHESSFFTVLDAAGILAKNDPFHGMPSYAEKYQKKRRTIPRLEGRPYVLKFFPRDLWQTVQPNYKPDGIFGGLESFKRHGLKRGFEDEEEEDEDDAAKRRKSDDDEESSRKGDREEGDDLDEDEEQDEQLVDDDFSEDDDEMGGDYNAEQYFDAGDDDVDGDAFGDGGGGGGDDNDTY